MNEVLQKWHDMYNQVYSRDNPKTEPYGWIQWKGTDVCMDIHCKCGHHGHVDSDFFYRYVCPECKTKYSVGENVRLIELTPEEVKWIETEHELIRFTTDT